MVKIAIYHLSIKIISRGKGRSAVAAAAYRAGEKIINEYDGMVHDYTHKAGVVHTEILLPKNAPAEYANRTILWNSVEKCERYKTAQLAREIEIALPVELSAEQNLSLVREFVNRHFVSAGMCADVCIHDKGDGNPHAHIMLTMRPIEKNGKWGRKSRTANGKKSPTVDWNEQSKAEEWRQGWADLVNQHLEKVESKERVDHRSYERQGVELIPSIHLGVSAVQMERRGIATSRGNQNRKVALNNGMLRQLRARISRLKKWVSEEKEQADLNLVKRLLSILNHSQEKSRYQKVTDLQMVSKAINFLQENEITNMAGLQNMVSDTYGRQHELSGKLMKNERRAKTLVEHIRHAEDYFLHRNLYRQYKRQKPEKQNAFYERHRPELMLYQSAARYLQQVMNGRTIIPLKSWKAELSTLTTENNALYQEYTLVKNEVQEVEHIRRAIGRIIRNEVPEMQTVFLNTER